MSVIIKKYVFFIYKQLYVQKGHENKLETDVYCYYQKAGNIFCFNVVLPANIVT